MTPELDCIASGDYVRLEPTRDVWQVLSVTADGAATLSPSSITLAGRPRRTAPVGQLRRVRPSAWQDAFGDDVF